MLDFSYRQGIPAIGFTVLTGALFSAFFAYAVVFMVKRKYPRNVWDIVFRILNWFSIVATTFFFTALILPTVSIYFLNFIFYTPLFAIALNTVMGYALTGGTLFAMILCAVLHLCKTRKITEKEKEILQEKLVTKKIVKKAVENGQYNSTAYANTKTGDKMIVGESKICLNNVDSVGKAGDQFNKEFLQNAEEEAEPIEYGEKTMQSIVEVESMMRDLNREQGTEDEKREALNIKHEGQEMYVAATIDRQQANGSIGTDDDNRRQSEDSDGIDEIYDTYDALRAKVFEEVREFSKTVELESKETNQDILDVADDSQAKQEDGQKINGNTLTNTVSQDGTLGAVKQADKEVDTAACAGYNAEIEGKEKERGDALPVIEKPVSQQQSSTPKRNSKGKAGQRSEYQERRAQRVKEALEGTNQAHETEDKVYTVNTNDSLFFEEKTAPLQKSPAPCKKSANKKAKPVTGIDRPQSSPVVTPRPLYVPGSIPPVQVISDKKGQVTIDKEKSMAAKKPTQKSSTPLFSDKKTAPKKSANKKQSAGKTPPKDSSIGRIPQIQEIPPKPTEALRNYAAVKRTSVGHLYDEYLANKGK